jgi:hypothetical protein
MKPIYYNEISYYIGKRIKMILCKNINLTYISVYINLQQNKVKVNINFKIYNTCKCVNSKDNEYNYSQTFIINKTLDHDNVMDNLIDSIIQDFEIKHNL